MANGAEILDLDATLVQPGLAERSVARGDVGSRLGAHGSAHGAFLSGTIRGAGMHPCEADSDPLAAGATEAVLMSTIPT